MRRLTLMIVALLVALTLWSPAPKRTQAAAPAYDAEMLAAIRLAMHAPATFIPPPGGAGQQAQGGLWKFAGPVRVKNDLNNHGHVLAELSNTSGGSVEIKIDGNAHGLCPGGSETLRFSWRFEQDLFQVWGGANISTTLAIERLRSTHPCTTQLSSRPRAYMDILSAGVVGPRVFSDDEWRRVDGERFYSNTYDEAAYAYPPEDATRTVTLEVRDHRPIPERRLGYFFISINTPAGALQYVYVYQEVSGRGSGGSGGGRSYGWVRYGVADCGGNDIGSTQGSAAPEASMCNANTAGSVAICWDASNYSNGPSPWCTYKRTPASQCRGGGAPGYAYECRASGG